jgi:ParB family chromosome partitioning protein
MARPVVSLDGRSLKFVKVSSLYVITDPSHPRYDARIEMPLDSTFLASVKEEGVLQPIAIRPDGEIVAGKQRWRAAKLAGIDFIPAIEFTGELSDLDLFLRRCAENNQRHNDEPATRIADARRLFAMGATVDQVSRSFGVQPSTAASYQNILENAVPETMALVEENALSIAAAAVIADQPKEAQPEIVSEVRASQLRALTSPKGKDTAITGSQKGDTRLEKTEDGTVRPVTSHGAVTEIASKVVGKERKARKANPAERTVTVKAVPSAMRSEATIQQRIARLTVVRGMHKGAAPELDLAIAALKWALGEDLEAAPEGVNAAAFTAAFVDAKA